jgi:hypothetical protein
MDRYDQEVERLTVAGNLAVQDAWFFGPEHSPLFDGLAMFRDGCCITLTARRVRTSKLCPPRLPRELCSELAADQRVPSEAADLTVESLPACREWQRRFDAALGRTPPPLLPEPGEVAP